MYTIKAILILLVLSLLSSCNQAQITDLRYTYLEKIENETLNEQDGCFIISDTTSFKSIVKTSISDTLKKVLLTSDIVLTIHYPLKKISINTPETETDLCRKENSKEPVEITLDKSLPDEKNIYIYILSGKSKYRTICP